MVSRIGVLATRDPRELALTFLLCEAMARRRLYVSQKESPHQNLPDRAGTLISDSQPPVL